MFNSAVLDLAIGLIFCFLTVSLATGTIVEAISSITKWRSKTLRDGVGQLLNDPNLEGLAKQLYAHAAINPRGPGQAAPEQNRPAYIDRQLFAHAMMDIAGISTQIAAAAGQPANPTQTTASLRTAVTTAIANTQLQQLLTGIVERSLGDMEKIQTELATWFDSAMDRVSGAYKRWTQLIGFLVALVLAAGLNIDSIGVAKTLWLQPALAEKLTADKDLKADQAINKLNAAIPIGWPNGLGQKVVPTQVQEVSGSKQDVSVKPFTGPDWGLAFLGWLITALTTLFGAPFWFDMLQTVIRLKGSGPSPKEKVEGKGAAA